MKKAFPVGMLLLVVFSTLSMTKLQTSSGPDESALEVAEKAATWVMSKAENGNPGYKWLFTDSNNNSYYTIHFGTGSAGIGIFLLKLYEATNNWTYLSYAKGAADYIVSRAVKADGGWKWPYYDRDFPFPNGIYLTDLFNGAAGIGLFLLKSYRATGNITYLIYAEGAAQWMAAHTAREFGGLHIRYCPDLPSTFPYDASDYVHGQAGIGAFLVDLYLSTGNVTYAGLAQDIAQYLLAVAEPEAGGFRWKNNHDAPDAYYGMASDGTGGIAMFLFELYSVVGNSTYLKYATGGIQWVLSQAIVSGNDAKWPRVYGASPAQYVLEDDSSGAFLGDASVGEILATSYQFTLNLTYLDYARKYANWIVSQNRTEGGGYKFPFEEEGTEFVPWANARIGRFLNTMSGMTGDSTYAQCVDGVVTWITSKAITENNGYKWLFVDGRDYSTWRGASGIAYNLISILRVNFPSVPRPLIVDFPDINSDGKINIIDVAIIAKHFGEQRSP